MKNFKYLLLAATIATFLLMVIGNLVRVNGASQGCPDWPTCYGQWFLPASFFARSAAASSANLPAMSNLTQIQLAHRVSAGLSAFLIVLSALIATFRYRADRITRFLLYAAVFLIAIEILIGGESVLVKDSAAIGLTHAGLALAILGLVAAATVTAFYTADAPIQSLAIRPGFNRLAWLTLAVTFALMLSGGLVVASGADRICTDQLICLDFSPMGLIQASHRLLTGLDTILVGILFFSAWKNQYHSRAKLSLATGVGILFIGQVLIGGLKVFRGMPVDLVWLHAATPAALWGCLTALTFVSGIVDESPVLVEEGRPVKIGQRLRDFFTLSKPVIVALLLVTTYAGMVVGGKQLPGAALTFWTLLSGALAAGGASAINQYIDRDLDKSMQRTSRRPLAAGRMTPAEGLAFGIGLCLLSFFIMAGFVNLPAALLSFAGMVYYVLLYSILLKRATVQNIVIGGGAGAIPPLVGWAAATGGLNFPSLFLFAIVFFWTPPHFWSLALVRRKDYERAGVPMLPVVRGEQVTRVQIFIYTLELVGLTLLMPLLKMAGSFYLVSAVVLGAMLIAASWQVYSKGGNKSAWMMYRYSSMYLCLLFLAMVLDVFI